LNITVDLVNFLARRNYNLDDLVIVYCIENEEKDLLNAYIGNRNINQSIALFQRFERKLLIERIGNIENFSVDNYITTEFGAALLLECMIHINNLDVIISESIDKIVTESEVDDLDRLVKKFLELYPKGRNRAGETLKSNEVDTKNKLKGFLKKYKYSEDIILKATKNYIEQQRRTGFEYCSAAHYFISKMGFGSKLASECENIVNGNSESISSFSDQLM